MIVFGKDVIDKSVKLSEGSVDYEKKSEQKEIEESFKK